MRILSNSVYIQYDRHSIGCALMCGCGGGGGSNLLLCDDYINNMYRKCVSILVNFIVLLLLEVDGNCI